MILGDCLEVMAGMEAGSVDAVVTDPPYDLRTGKGRGFMGAKWDGTGVPFDPATWKAVARVLRPGRSMLAFGGTRTHHRLMCAIEDAGFEIKDVLMWLHGQGFPKGKSCLKPAWEPIVLARKPGGKVPALEIDRCRIGTTENLNGGAYRGADTHQSKVYNIAGNAKPDREFVQPAGRWPANLCLSHHPDCREVGTRRVKGNGRKNKGTVAGYGLGHTGKPRGGHGDPDGRETVADWRCVEGCPIRQLDEQAGNVSFNPAGVFAEGQPAGWSGGKNNLGRVGDAERSVFGYGDTGGPSRFFYCSKASRRDRGEGNTHKTVKPHNLMRWLCRLITPPGGTILDPFAGSASTGLAAAAEGFGFVGIERDPAYVKIAKGRLKAARAAVAPGVAS